MTALWTTRLEQTRRLRRAGHGLVLALSFAVLIGIIGCNRETREEAEPASPDAATATDRPMLTHLSAPRSEWINYSPNDRKLTLYTLPAAGRWMIKRSDLTSAYPIGPEYVLPEKLDPNETVVYYIRPGGQTSRSVTLAQIQAARPEHMSLATP